MDVVEIKVCEEEGCGSCSGEVDNRICADLRRYLLPNGVGPLNK